MADTLAELAAQLRVDSIRATTAAGSGHPSSSMSAADIVAVLFQKYLRFDFQHPHAPDNDRFVLSKGHACPVLYAAFKAAGAIDDAELLSLRQFGSRLEGHPNPHVLPLVDVATGSLGQGLAIGVGMALTARLDQRRFRTYVMMGDSETAEGSVWEAFDKAAHYQLDTLCALIDMNRLGQSGETELGWNGEAYVARARAFGWHALAVDGHDLGAIDRALAEAQATKGKPTCLVFKTEKGHGYSLIANHEHWHGKPLPEDKAREAIQELGGERNLRFAVRKPEVTKPSAKPAAGPLKLPTYATDEKVATRKVYGDALAALGDAHPDLVALDAEVSNSTYSEELRKAHPDRYFEMYIAEQNMVSSGVGMAVLGKRVFVSTFAAFLSRAYDQLRMAAVSNATLHVCGSHAGVSIGEDGPSQMGLEDLAMMRAVAGSTVLYPSDANQTARLMAALVDLRGISYLRTTRAKTPVLYAPTEEFPIGGSKVLRRSDRDVVTLVAAGITLHEALEAHARLQDSGVAVRVIDLYSVKPVDVKTLRQAAKETQGRLLVVEDHWAEGGLADAVLEAFSDGTEPLPRVKRLAVRKLPGSGKPEELLAAAGIDAAHIVEAVHALRDTPAPEGSRATGTAKTRRAH
ncbi:transketolase [Myxococcus fulvus]|uniref:Transketolase n=1 Tax=Myxococcus fulvus TaxID=33 RepID=A0A511SVK1_MYXFU|nr:transketolase [Myxococcus fulvus]GEN05919.1 transketolase [Myxococcus fulvus]SET63538.1 transketolase [Myxococcus fulvus]